MPAVTWIQGKDLITVNLAAGAGINNSVLTVPLASGNTTLLPAAPFYLFFPGNVGAGELPEFIYVTSKSGDNLLLGPPPFGNTGGTGRAALRNDLYTPQAHPGGAVLELRSTWEMFLQLQTQMGAHEHTGATGDGAIIQTGSIADNAITTVKIGALQVTAAKIANNTITATQMAAGAATGAVLGSDVVTTGGGQVITGGKVFSGGVGITGLAITTGSGDAPNDLYYRGSSANLVALHAPTNGDFVLTNSAGVPAWGYTPKRYARLFMLMGA